MDKILNFVDEHLSAGEIDGKSLKVSWAESPIGTMPHFKNLNMKISLSTKIHHWLESIMMTYFGKEGKVFSFAVWCFASGIF